MCTFAIAAIKCERQFIGSEIDPTYCKIANEQIKAVQKIIPLPF